MKCLRNIGNVDNQHNMEIITDTDSLSDLCQAFSKHRYVTVDTEFLRESTYWPELCLIQMAVPGRAAIIDPLSKKISLDPFFKLMAEQSVTKVFHAARQDIEIIYNLGKLIPAPLFDTQVAAMVCGYGDSVSYDQLVHKITGKRIDKTSRFTDWSQRPLSKKQLNYALSDVTHLCDVYVSLNSNLKEQDREHWVEEEMLTLTSEQTYNLNPADAWKRMKLRVKKPRDFAVFKAVARWREEEARKKNVPRSRILKDDGVFEVSQQQPLTREALSRLRAIPKGFDRSVSGERLLTAVNKAMQIPAEELEKLPRGKQMPEGSGAALELLKVLLKMTSEQHGVAAKVIATVDDLEKLVIGTDDSVAALNGWRRELFGNDALRLKNGEIALHLGKKSVEIVSLHDQA